MSHATAGGSTPHRRFRRIRRSRRWGRLATALAAVAGTFALLAVLAATAAAVVDRPLRQLRSDIEIQAGSGAYPQDVARFYAGRNFEPLWIDATKVGPLGRKLTVRPEARRVADLAAGAHEPAARAAFRALAAATGRDTASLARAELAASAALGAYVRGLAPSGAEPLAFIDAELARPKDDGAVLHQAASAPSLKAYVAAVAEVNPVYRDLKAGLGRYRATWSRLPQTPIAEGPPLGAGDTGPRVDALRGRLGLAAAAGLGTPFDARLVEAVRRFQGAHGIVPSGALDPDTLAALNRGAAYYERLIEANLNRARALPPVVGGRVVLVNVAARQLALYEGGRPARSMRVIVGSRQEQTPMMAGLIRYLVFNPYWNVPVDMVRTSVAPRVLSEGPGYLRRARMEVLSDWDDMPVRLDPRTVDWEGVSRGWRELRVRQLPGGDNMMGRMKFMAANELGIYLHDTPHKTAFQSSDRLLSAGCVRLEAADALASWLLGGALPDVKAIGLDREAYLPAPLPLYITYLTAAPAPSGVVFHPDVYGKDAPQPPAGAPR